MAGTLTQASGGGGLILTIPEPTDRPDLSMVRVWMHTSSMGAGNPSSTYQVFHGKALTVALMGIAIELKYVKWAYVSEIDSADYDADATELSATPLPIDGTVMADEFRGKRIIGGVYIDAGSAAAENKAAAASPNTTTTLNVTDATDFSAFGGAIVVLPQDRDRFFAMRYTGKTGNQLTGVSGNMYDIRSGDPLLAVPYAAVPLWESPGGAIAPPDDFGDMFFFRRAGGTGAVVEIQGLIDGLAQTFTYTAGHTGAGPYYAYLAGVAGNPAFAYDGVPRTVIDTTDLPTTASLSLISYTSLTLTGDVSKFQATGGSVMLIKDGQSQTTVNFASITGQVLSIPDGFTPPATGVYIAVPLFSLIAVGSNASLFSINTEHGMVFVSPRLSSVKALSTWGPLTAYHDIYATRDVYVSSDLEVTDDLVVGGTASGPDFLHTVFKSAIETVNNTVALQADNDLLFAVEASKKYVAKFVLFITGPAAADFKFDITGPASPTGVKYGEVGAETQSTAFSSALTSLFATTVKNLVVEFSMRNGVNAGTVTLRWAQNTATVGDTSIRADSYVEWREVA